MNEEHTALVATLDCVVYPPICADAAAAIRALAGELADARSVSNDYALQFRTLSTERDTLRSEVAELISLLREAEPWVSNCDEVPSEIVTRIDAALSAGKFTDGHGNDITHLLGEKR